MRKAQSSVEFMLVVLFYIIVVVTLLTSILRVMPSEISNIQEQRACSQAELIANAFFNFPGNETDWPNGTLYEFGLTTDDAEAMRINYTKWMAAKERGYYNVTRDDPTTIPYNIRYEAYAFNNTQFNDVDWSTVSFGNASAFISRETSNIIEINAGAFSVGGAEDNSTTFEFRLVLFFPFTSAVPGLSDCTGGGIGGVEPEDKNNTILYINPDDENYNHSELYLKWNVSNGDSDCLQIALATGWQQMVFIRDMHAETVVGTPVPIYLGNHTIINSEFGSTGYIDSSKSFCKINRVGLLEHNYYNGTSGSDEVKELVPIKLEVISWH
jgi:hypothetical protein